METIPDFVKLAQAYGHRGLRVEQSMDVPEVFADVMADKTNLVFVDVLTDRSENVYPTIAPEQPLTQMLLRPQIVAEEL